MKIQEPHESDATRRLSLSEATWCPGCGALVAPGATVCPKCGMVLVEPELAHRRERVRSIPEIGNTSAMDPITAAGPSIESALPSNEISAVHRPDRLPRGRMIALTALITVAIFGGATLFITHPWDPTATQTRAKEPADTGRAGFPGEVNELRGQDVREDSDDEQKDVVFENLATLHTSLGDFSKQVDTLEQRLRTEGTSASQEVRKQGLKDAQELGIKISNTITKIREADDGAGVYRESIDHLLTLGNWLRNRSDALTKSWDRSVSAEDPKNESAEILRSILSAKNFAELFSQSYEAWTPHQAS